MKKISHICIENRKKNGTTTDFSLFTQERDQAPAEARQDNELSGF